MKQKLVPLILVGVGCIIFAFTIPEIHKSVEFKRHGIQTVSTVMESKSIRHSKGKSTYFVTVSFSSPDGKVLTATAEKRFVIYKGDKVTIWYDKNDPRFITFGDTIGYNIRVVIFGGIFFFFGIYLFVRHFSEDIKNKQLRRSGMKISAEYVSVYRNEKYRMAQYNPWVIKCKWIDNRNNREYLFISKDYIKDPAPFLNGRYHIDVYINPSDPSKYYMDTSFMPEGSNFIV
jgi:hypothetical protein